LGLPLLMGLSGNMRRFLCLISLTILCVAGRAEMNTDSLGGQLAQVIGKAREFDSLKIKRIDSIRILLYQPDNLTIQKKYEIEEQLYESYKLFKYDSAYFYARDLLKHAYELKDVSLISGAKMKISFILLSAGLYKETFDSLSTILISDQSSNLKAEYYTLFGRYYYDIAGYDNDHYHSVDYDIIGSRYMDSALLYFPKNSFEEIYYRGLRKFKDAKIEEALPYFNELISQPGLTDHQYALVASTMSGIYLQKNETGEAIRLLTRAAEADIRSSTKETFAVFNLAGLLFKLGDLKYASVFIESAIENAAFYGARQRKVQMSALLPLIEGERINSVEAQRNILVKYSLLVTGLGLILVWLTTVILRQIKKLKAAKEIISQAHLRQEINNKLEEVNHRLEEVNEKLEEANKIKEEYIGYFFNMDSEFFNKLEKLKRNIELKLSDRKFDEIKFIVNNINSKKEKEELLVNFDKVFLKLFPNFIESYNRLFQPEDQIQVKDNVLDTDHRIFALIRMGITDSEKIAQILDYSVKTIYAYKTRIKNRSLFPKEFEERIMRIKTV
jgi:hypothetical protein